MIKPTLQRLAQSPLVRNFSVLTGATMISYLMSFFVVMHVARTLGPEEYGKVGFAQAFVSYFMLIASMGLETLGLRDIAKDKSRAISVLTNITILRLVLFSIAYSVMVFFLYLFPRDHISNIVVLVFGGYMLLTPVMQEWYYMGNENFKIVGMSRIVHSILYCGLIFLLIRRPGQVVEFTALQVGANIIPLAVLWYPLLQRINLRYFDFAQIRVYLRSGVWLMLSSFMAMIYLNMDKVMIGYLLPGKYLGWYDAAYKIILVLIVPSSLLWGVMSPRISRFERRDILLWVAGMAVVGAGIALCIFPVRHWIVDLVFGIQYAPAAAPLGILALSMFANHCAKAFSFPLQVWRYERYFFFAALAGACVNVILNVLLIPRYELEGAAWATMAADTTVALCALPFFVRGMRKGKARNE